MPEPASENAMNSTHTKPKQQQPQLTEGVSEEGRGKRKRQATAKFAQLQQSPHLTAGVPEEGHTRERFKPLRQLPSCSGRGLERQRKMRDLEYRHVEGPLCPNCPGGAGYSALESHIDKTSSPRLRRSMYIQDDYPSSYYRRFLS